MKTTLTLIMSLILSSRVCAGVLPPDAVVDGKTIGEWSAEWWKWVYSLSTNQHPLFDTTGGWATNGQPDCPVFFLAGIFIESGMAQRSLSVPEGKYLFLPLVNVAPDCIGTPPPCTAEQLRDHAKSAIDLVTGLQASIDGVAVPNLFTHRATSPVFNFDFQTPDNILSLLVGHPIVGLDDPIVAEGYWLMVEPLLPGNHLIRFGATVGPPVNFTLDITAAIEVVRNSLTSRVEKLIVVVQGSIPAPNRCQPMLASLSSAKTSFEKDNVQAGVNQLRAFQNKIRAQVARIDSALGEEFIRAAQQIIDQANRE